MYKMSESDMRRRSRKSRKLVGGFSLFGPKAVGEDKKYKSEGKQKEEDITKLKKEIYDIEIKIKDTDDEEKKAIDAIKTKVKQLKRDLDQKKANLKKLTSWFGGGRRSRRVHRTHKK